MKPFLNPPEERAKSCHSLLGPQGTSVYTTWYTCVCTTHVCVPQRHMAQTVRPCTYLSTRCLPPSGHRPMRACSPQQLPQCPHTAHAQKVPTNERRRTGRHNVPDPCLFSPCFSGCSLNCPYLSRKSAPRTRHKNPKVTPCETKSNLDAIHS